MEMDDLLLPEERQAVELLYEIAVNIAEIESLIEARCDDFVEVEKLQQKLVDLEDQQVEIWRQQSNQSFALQIG